MKSTILISRMMRVIETEGAIGDGASLADEYSASVRQVNSRLEAVQAAIDAKQVSDAVRMMEDSPRLLDEVGTLDFNQLPDWEVLCSRHNWTPPLKIDKSLLERVLILNDSTETVEPFLRMYRKAVRTNNNRLAVQSLRQLAQIDHSQNWKINLVQAEDAVQKQLISDFRAARNSGDVDECDRLALEFVETNWSDVPTLKGADEIRAYMLQKEIDLRNVEGAEDLSIIKRCMNENWNRPLAMAMLQAVDGFAEKGFVIPVLDRDMVDACRKRCAEEIETEEKERRWKDLCERLHAAIQQENTTAIRDVLSAPEFLDREPDPDMLKSAQLVIQHEEAARKRKVLQIAVCSMAGLFAILALSGWWLRQKLFDDRCEGEAIKLAALQNGSHAVDRLAEALRRLQQDDPEVYADPRVNVFDGKLKTLQSKMVTRTNEIASVLSELKSLKESDWGDNVEAVTGRIERVASLITKDDDKYRNELLALKSAWSEHCEAVESSSRNTATKFHETLVAHIKVVTERLKTELLSDDLKKEVDSCKASISEWNRIHAEHATALEGTLVEAAKSLVDAENMQKNLNDAIQKLKASSTAEGYLAARKTLVEYYSGYPFVKGIGDHPVAPEDAAAVVANTTAEQVQCANMLKAGVEAAEFKTFLADNVVTLAEIPSYSSLYGVFYKGGGFDRIRSEAAYGKRGDEDPVSYFAICKGRPVIKKPSYDSSIIVDGELLDFKKADMVRQISKSSTFGEVVARQMLDTEEICSVIDLCSRPNMTCFEFEGELLKLVSGHMKFAERKQFKKEEIEIYGQNGRFAVDRFPSIRRVQLLQLYFTWLKDDLKLMPQDGIMSRWLSRVERLAQPVRVGSIPEDLTWACMYEKRVRQRNTECAKLLAQMAEEKFIDEYRELRKARMKLRRLLEWKIEYAGCIAFDPYDARWTNDKLSVLPSVKDGVKKDHPLYVLRREGGALVLKPALVPSKSGKGWAIKSGMTNELVAGDPLFQVSERDAAIDAERTIADIMKEIPARIAKQYADKITLFKIEVK